MSNDASGAYHEDPGRFRDALMLTASETGFSDRLIEKDYYCSVLLNDLEALYRQGLVFNPHFSPPLLRRLIGAFQGHGPGLGGGS